MNSGKAARDKAHKQATQIAWEERCLSCGAPSPSMPCHYPRHRGLGSGHAGWSTREWVPLCYNFHEILDRRQNNMHMKRSHIIDAIEAALKEGLWP